MPEFNLTIPDTSPVIVYANGAWGDSSHTDPEWNRYANGTFHPTQDNGATASLIFNGSAVYVIGAKRTNHGPYAAFLDGTVTPGNGAVKSDTFNVVLFSQTGLGTDQHSLTMQNQWDGSNPTWFDIDYMYITSGDGNPNTPSIDVVLDDGHPNITYSPGWDNSPNNLIQHYFNNTMHRTNTKGASASIAFYGNAITVYGATSGNHGPFSVALDGVPLPLTLNGSATAFRPQNMLYYSGGLSTTLHHLTIANVDSTGLFFDLDKVVVSTWPTADFEAVSSSGTSSSALAYPPVSKTISATESALASNSVPGSSSSASTPASSASATSGTRMAAAVGGIMPIAIVVTLLAII